MLINSKILFQISRFAEKLRQEVFPAILATDTDSYSEDFREIYDCICPPTHEVRQNSCEEIPPNQHLTIVEGQLPYLPEMLGSPGPYEHYKA